MIALSSSSRCRRPGICQWICRLVPSDSSWLSSYGGIEHTRYRHAKSIDTNPTDKCEREMNVDFPLLRFVSFPDSHNDVIKLKHFPRYWPFVWGIHRSSVNSPHKGQWRWALMFSLISAWLTGWVDNRQTVDSGHDRADYDATVMNARRIDDIQQHNTGLIPWRNVYPIWLLCV